MPTLGRLTLCFAAALTLILPAHSLQAREKDDAEAAARALAQTLEKEQVEFRADAWVKDLSPEVGKAVKVQMFKGNDYRVCIAVPKDSGVRITAMVLDLAGRPVGEIQPVEEGWGCILFFKPPKTGVYVVAVRQEPGGKAKEVACAMLTGYK